MPPKGFLRRTGCILPIIREAKLEFPFGAAKLNLKIIEIPMRYRERTYGATNISSFADGWLLLRMSAKAAAKLFFIPAR